MNDARMPLICLSASGGGHARQLLDISAFWREYPHFFVTEDTVLGRSIARSETVEFVPHFALGQARMGKLVAMFTQSFKSIWRSGSIILRHRPDLVVCTGAGSQLFVLIWARLIGARVILIDSFARFQAPSKFAKFAGWLAHVRIAQSELSASKWKGAIAFDPLRTLDTRPPQKQKLVLSTVGAILPFDRLTNLVIEAKRAGLLPEHLVMQIGHGGDPVEPIEGVEIHEELPFNQLLDLLADAELVVCHGGTGSLITALNNHCRVIAVPRRAELNDAYDNHQLEIIEAFQARGLIETAEDLESFKRALTAVRRRRPTAIRMEYTALTAFLHDKLHEFFPQRSSTQHQAAE